MSEKRTVQGPSGDTVQGGGPLSERNKGVQVISGEIPADVVPPSTSMVTPTPEAPPPEGGGASGESAE